MDKDFINLFVALFVAAGGWVVAVITVVIGYLERRSAREEERLARTMDYFDGGSQRRSIGISMIEGLWLANSRYHSVLVPLIANQIVYLLLSSDSHDAHNERNLIRLVTIFKAIPNLRERYFERWGDVCDAISRKYAGEPKGIPIPGPTLKLWARDLGHELHDP
jgi:hypothetical protein